MARADEWTSPELRIETPETVAITREVAGVGSRCAALAIDSTLIGVAVFGLEIAVVALASALFKSPLIVIAIGVVVGAAVMVVYFPLFSRLTGASIGKRLLGLRVVDAHGRNASTGAHVVRSLALLIDAFIPVPALSVGMVMLALSRDGRRLGDILAGTYVVREEKGTVDAGEPFRAQRYAELIERKVDLPIPAVRRLRGEDLVTLRSYHQRRGEFDASAAIRLRTALVARFAAALEIPRPTDEEAFLRELFLCLRDERSAM
ncbi:MAG: RDD family protein [Planctomycetes bacterium]|nr:RDD family protein [Planctomycetota bacterium]